MKTRIEMYDRAIRDLHEVKVKHGQEKITAATEIAIEFSIVAGIVITLLTLAALTPSFIQSFLNVF